MANNKEFIERLRFLRSRFISDGIYSPSCLTIACAEAADIIEKLDKENDELRRKDLITRSKNEKIEKELEFTRKFIIKHDMQYALMSEWNDKYR